MVNVGHRDFVFSQVSDTVRGFEESRLLYVYVVMVVHNITHHAVWPFISVVTKLKNFQYGQFHNSNNEAYPIT